MRIDGLIENTLKNSRLKRVRVKVDPSQLVTQGYENVGSFEGYVLEENDTTVQVYLLNVPKEFDNVQTVDKKYVSPSVAPTINPSFNNTKQKLLKQLENDGVTPECPVYKQIQNCESPDFIDSFLKSAGYDDNKLADLYRRTLLQEADLAGLVGGAVNKLKSLNTQNVAGKLASGLKSVEKNPLFQITKAGTQAISKLPGLIVGKNNIIGRVAKFMKSFDVNDLIAVDKYKLEYKGEKEPEVGDSVYIKGLNLPGLGTKKFGSIEYQIRGVYGNSKVQKKRKTNTITDIYPVELRRQLSLELDYAILDNPEKTATLVIDFIDTKIATRYYEVKVDDFKNNLILTVVRRLDEREGNIAWRLMQDEVIAAVSKALIEFLNGRKLDSLDSIIAVITTNILKDDKDKRLTAFDKAMVDLTKNKSAMASTNPEVYLKKYLEPIGLYK